MYRSAELSEFEKVNMEHDNTGSILSPQPDLQLDSGSADLIQGLLLAIVAGGAMLVMTTVAVLYLA